MRRGAALVRAQVDVTRTPRARERPHRPRVDPRSTRATSGARAVRVDQRVDLKPPPRRRPRRLPGVPTSPCTADTRAPCRSWPSTVAYTRCARSRRIHPGTTTPWPRGPSPLTPPPRQPGPPAGRSTRDTSPGPHRPRPRYPAVPRSAGASPVPARAPPSRAFHPWRRDTRPGPRLSRVTPSAPWKARLASRRAPTGAAPPGTAPDRRVARRGPACTPTAGACRCDRRLSCSSCWSVNRP